MGFALDPAQDRPLRAALRESLLAQVEGAAAELRGGIGAEGESARGRAHAPGESPHELDDEALIKAVHETRKALKRARAVLRLLRRAVGSKRARNEASRLSEIARQLSAARDAQVLRVALSRLLESSDEVHVTEAIRVAQATQEGAVPALAASTREEVLADLCAARERLEGLRLRGSINKALRSGLRRMLRRIRTEYGRAIAEPTAENFHTLRRRCKDFYYAARLLEDTSPDLLAPMLGELDRLGEALGEEHDLTILLERLHAQRAEWGGEAVVALLEPLIERERQRLRAEARPPCERLVALAPRWFARAVVNQLRAVWKNPPEPEAAEGKAPTKGAEPPAAAPVAEPRAGDVPAPA
jgi:CHAD domain-containing protein